MLIEVIVKNEKEAQIVEELGAHRIELVSAMSEGGLTPSYGAIRRVVESVNIPVQVMIRNHGHSFIYQEEDLNIMKEDLKIAKQLGANGIVFGCLNEDGTINENILEEILKLADGMDFTFHRAFDSIPNQEEAYKALCKFGNSIHRILTSGGKAEAPDAKVELRQLVELSKVHNGPLIMPGSGMTMDNINEMRRATGAKEFHLGIAYRSSLDFL